MNNNALYREEILAHYRQPQNFGKLKKAGAEAHVLNPLCGDEITLQINFDKKSKVKEVKFFGTGCALSIASASLFTEFIKDKTRAQLKKLPSAKPEQLLGLKVGPARKKCARLPYDALQGIIQTF